MLLTSAVRCYDFRLKAAADRLDFGGLVATILTVHGTYATGPELGEAWWQLGCEFEKDVRRQVKSDDGSLQIRPVIWDGTNSQMSRSAAAHKLADLCQYLDGQRERYAIVAHSHGGNIASMAATSGRGFRCLSKVISVGTPYLLLAKSTFLFNRMGLVAKSILVSFLTMTMITLSLIPLVSTALGPGPTWARLTTLSIAVLIFSLPVLAVYAWLRIKDARRFRSLRASIIRRSQEQFGTRWACIYDANDEAIQGLGTLHRRRINLIDDGFAVPAFSLLSLFVVPLGFLLAAASPDLVDYALASLRARYPYWNDKAPSDLISNMSHLYAYVAYGFWEPLSAWEPHSQYGKSALAFFIVLIIFPATLFALSFLITVVTIGCATVLSGVASRALNQTTWHAIRRSVSGSDAVGEMAVDVRHHPHWFGPSRLGALPAGLSVELNEFSNASASKAVPHMRAMLHQLAFSGDLANPGELAAKYFTWSELIHTSYFSVPRFRKFVCYIIANSEGFKPTEAFLQDPDYRLCEQWWREMQPAAELQGS